jgi:Cellulase (glycosyl hydrolase family 5)
VAPLRSAPAAAAAGPLTTAVVDDAFLGPDAKTAFDRARSTGATAVRIVVLWSSVAPERPIDPADPADPAYRWADVDQAIRLAVADGLLPFLDLVNAPQWAAATGRDRPSAPNPVEFGRFAKAAAMRYSGSFDGLPRVRYWQAWNEPNLSLYLEPQYVETAPFSPGSYRTMVNEFAAGVKSVHGDNLVIAGGTAPFGGDNNVPPLTFMREFLCLSASLQPKCTEKVHLDIWAHHPYTSGGPTHQAFNANDASLGDLPEMRRVLTAGVESGNIVSSQPVEFWVTEFSWDSNPPDPKAVPIHLQARWVAEALYRMWNTGVSLVTWFTLRDQPLYQSFYQSGLFFDGASLATARPKPAFTAFRFPVVGIPIPSGFLVWGRSPSGKPGRVIIEQSFKGGWNRLAMLRTDPFGIFQRSFKRRATGTVRASLAGLPDRTIPFGLKPVADRSYNPFGKTTLDPGGP